MSQQTKQGSFHVIKKLFAAVILSTLAFFAVGCSTTSQFKVPPKTELEVYGRHVAPRADGIVKTRPFFWSAAGGIPYSLKNESGQVVRQGKLKSRFRVVSIFWPPFALIYWPMGFGSDQYDLTKEADGYMVRDMTNTMNAPAPVEPAPEAVAPAPAPKAKKKK